MSTSFSTGYDAIVARIAALLPSHNRLPDAKELNKNPDTHLKQGWGWGLADGAQNTYRTIGCQQSIRFNFTLAITRQSYALDLDAAKRGQVEKDLIEDLRVIMTDIGQNNFNLATPIIRFDNAVGIQPVRTANDSYVSLVMNISIEFIF